VSYVNVFWQKNQIDLNQFFEIRESAQNPKNKLPNRFIVLNITLLKIKDYLSTKSTKKP